ncbi:hypothetical protein DSCO28_33180 [Desulfosarcina ovata subsp. sediminis]|uniref:Heparinase II/III-like C-terminal domain-containing protein n=1 Tax=Desulfosarcina ovata subsp. sediminis TaxID=885957 RepID=A0A5K7ZKQ5_9BACT|nr:hypothetical protein DSCO28_33180 [Desulfosarcina ovata subsp. sediminis]
MGFVLDAILHYYQLEDGHIIPEQVNRRVTAALSFVKEMILPDGRYPDFGDRDDGYVFRSWVNPETYPYLHLLETGRTFFNNDLIEDELQPAATGSGQIDLKRQTYPHGGMTLVQKGMGRILFRHADLGLEPLFGHGHADALSTLFWWDDQPVLIDLGSGQYNGDQGLRDYFRSTIAHNTVEIGGENQAAIYGPFMWDDSYHTTLHYAQDSPHCWLCASHDGYLKNFKTIHERSLEWIDAQQLKINDCFWGPGGISFKGAFHLGECNSIDLVQNVLIAKFSNFSFSITFPRSVTVNLFYGSSDPFLGWRSTVYGNWTPCYTIIYDGMLEKEHTHTLKLGINQL